MKVLNTFTKTITVHLDESEKREAMKCLNLHYLGDENCNYYDPEKKKYIAKYPDKETKEFVDASRNAHMVYRFTVKVDLMEDGTLRLHKPVDNE